MAITVMHTLTGGTLKVDTAHDEMILSAPGNKPAEPDYLLHVRAGRQYWYVYRPSMTHYGQKLNLLCEEVDKQEIQEALLLRAQYDDLSEYDDLARLHTLGFVLLKYSDESLLPDH